MTFEKAIRAQLESRGVWGNDADTIMNAIKTADILKPMARRWNDNPDDYPLSILTTTWLSAKLVALDWIDENIPLAFFRSLFAD